MSNTTYYNNLLYLREIQSPVMKLYYSFLVAIALIITSCSSDANKFSGVWQSINDPSKQIIFTHSGDSYTFETRNIPTPLQGMPGTYNAKEHALEFDKGNGEITRLVYNVTVKHILGLGEEFEKSKDAVIEKDAETTTAETTPAETTTEEAPAEKAPEENASVADNSTNCAKGKLLSITGNNVRVRSEPDLTKQNILFQVHKNYEVVHLDDKTVDGQKWYKVCYDGNIGWVSGQYATKK